MTTRDYYEVLGLTPMSDGATVDQAYWHLAKAYQTQAEADPRARQLLDELNEAYGVLGTPRLRDDYDLQLTSLRGPAKSDKKRKATTSVGASWLTFPRGLFRKQRAATEKPSLVRAPTASAITRTVREQSPPPTPRREKADVTELCESTSKMLARWRTNSGTQRGYTAESAPDMTLVDIFKSEQELSDQEDPLSAVMEVLKAPRDAVPVNQGQ